MSQRTAGGLVRCPRGPNTQELSGQELSGRVEHPHTLVLADHFRVRGSHMRAVPSRCPMLLSLGTLADPAPSFPEANSTHATHAFLSLQFIAAPTMTPHHDGMACAPTTKSRTEPRRSQGPSDAHDGAQSSSSSRSRRRSISVTPPSSPAPSSPPPSAAAPSLVAPSARGGGSSTTGRLAMRL